MGSRIRLAAFSLLVAGVLAFVPLIARGQSTSPALPTLDAPVNDFAHVIDASSASSMDAMIRELQQKTGDAVVVATVPSLAPYDDIRQYAVKLFENGGRGIGERGKDNGLLILLAPNSRRVWIEVGYGLEEFITDGFSGEVSRDDMTPEFRNGNFGAGLLAGTSRIIGRIAQARGITITGVAPEPVRDRQGTNISLSTVIAIFVVILILSRMSGGPGRRRNLRRWGGNGWSGWSSGVGPFGGGGWGGGRGWGGGGGSFGGGFGGFGGGRSGGGGGGASW